MTLTTRWILTPALLLALAAGAFAQETTTATTTAAETSSAAKETAATTSTEAAADGPSSYEVRNRFTSLLHRHPHELTQILKLDPGLLSNDLFVAGYPLLAEFVKEHPEVRHNTRFYLAEFPYPGQNNSVLDDVVEMILVACGFGLAVFAFAWLIRTIIEQRRWSRLSRVQTDVHTKILDRFGTSQEVLEYIRTPAGTKFLESAPIPLHASRAVPNAPHSRILWSIQIGVVIAIGALGMILVSFRFEGETAQGLFAMGAIGFCVGIGFVASALVSMGLSRRLGVWEERATPPLDESGLVR